MILEYKPGRMNHVTNALSCKAELIALKVEQGRVNQVQATLLAKIQDGLLKDPTTTTLK